MIQPSDFGAPERFSTFRKEQAYAFGKLVDSPAAVNVAGLPTGVGKTLLAWTYARFLGARAVYLVGTKGLQDQVHNDMGMLDVRGMSNYACRLLEPTLAEKPWGMCDSGPCLDGESCIFKKSGCLYYDKWRQGREEDLVVTNYDAWFAHPISAQFNLGPRDLVICDEAHTLAAAITSAVGVSFTGKEVKKAPGMERWEVEDWKTWAGLEAMRVEEALKEPDRSSQSKRALRATLLKLYRLYVGAGAWGMEWEEGPWGWKVALEPISPAPYVNSSLLRGASRALLLSATIRPSHLTELGLEGSTFFETGSPFPVSTRPIYGIELGFNLNASTSETNLKYWVSRMDQWMRPRLPRKGILHSVSYDRARFIKEHSAFGKFMLLPADAKETREAVERFKTMPAPGILVSPSIHTGWDFPGDTAEWQIISKVPYSDTRKGLAAARQAADPLWDTRRAIDTLQQAAGRIVRKPGDRGETGIFDDSIFYLWKRHRSMFSRWFQEAFQRVEEIPPVLGGI